VRRQPNGYSPLVFRGAADTGGPIPDDRVLIGSLSVSGDPQVHGEYLRRLRAGPEDPFMLELFEDSIPRGGAVVDGGAYTGLHTLVAARCVGPRGKVLSFEPNPVTYRALRRNVRENGFEDRVISLPLGVSAWSGRRTFYIGADDQGKSGLFVPERWRQATRTRTLSLDSSVAGRSIDVIKLDVDGGEVDALRGMKRTLELSPRVRLFVECNPDSLENAGSTAGALLEELGELGFEVQVIDEARRALVPAGPWLSQIGERVFLRCEMSGIRRRLSQSTATHQRVGRRPAPAALQG
jgi:FkbM family methyltransferase